MAQENVGEFVRTHLGALGTLSFCFLVPLVTVVSVSGCSAVSSKAVPIVECEVSDSDIAAYARAAAELHNVEFLGPDVADVEIHRYKGRIGYIAARYVGERRAVETHRELMIWMQCNGLVDSIAIGQSEVYERDN
jgi:hypothetical protein